MESNDDNPNVSAFYVAARAKSAKNAINAAIYALTDARLDYPDAITPEADAAITDAIAALIRAIAEIGA